MTNSYLSRKSPTKHSSHSFLGWVDRPMFEDWFLTDFVREAKRFLLSKNLPPIGLLLVDNCAGHSRSLATEDGSFVAIFLPPRVTSLIQPADQHLINSLKCKFRRKMDNVVIERALRQKRMYIQVQNDISHLEIYRMIGEAWSGVNSEEFWKCWRAFLGENYLQKEEELLKGKISLFHFDSSYIPCKYIRREGGGY